MNDVRGIAIGIPAHNEAGHIDETLSSVLAAAQGSLPVVVVVAVDSSRDETRAIAEHRLRTLPRNIEAHIVHVGARCAGVARERACRIADAHLQARVGSHVPRWVATTDADTTVPLDWLSIQLRWADRGADAITGLVRVDAAEALVPSVRHHLDRELRRARLHHAHVFGANLGVRAQWWRRVGGFPPIAVGEDSALVERLRAAGARVIGVPDSIVLTSGRLEARAPGGFGATLAALTRQTRSDLRAPSAGCR